MTQNPTDLRAAIAPTHPAHGPLAPLPGVEDLLRRSGGRAPGLDEMLTLRVPTPPGLGERAIHTAVQALVDRHDALRLRATAIVDDLWDLEVLPVGTITAELHTATADDPRARLSAEDAIMVAANWLTGDPDQPGTLTLAVHPFAADPFSLAVMFDELSTALRRAERGDPIEIAAVPGTLRDYAQWTSDTAADPELVALLPQWQQISAASARPFGDVPAAEYDPAPVRLRIPIDRFAADLAALAVPLESALLAATSIATAHTVGGAALVVDLVRDGRATSATDRTGLVGRFQVVAPVALTPQTDAILALADARQQLRAQPLAGVDYALLRHLNPQTSLALDANTIGDITLEIVDHSALGVAVDPVASQSASPLSLVAVLEQSADQHWLAVTLDAAPGTAHDVVGEFADAWERAIQQLAELVADPANQVNLVPADLTRVDLTVGEVTAVQAASSALLDDIWPLSPLQQGLYFQSRFAGDSAAADIYTAQFSLEFDRELDAETLRGAFAALLRRHPSLRAGVVDGGRSDPVQIIAHASEVPLSVLDLSHLGVDECARALDDALTRDRATGFDLARPPLWRALLIHRTGAGDVLAINRQFLLWDGWSNGPFISQLLSYYTDLTQDTSPHLAFPEYLSWLHARDIATAREYWRSSFADLTEPCLVRPNAPLDVRVMPQVRRTTLSAADTDALEQRARQHAVTLNTVLNAVLALTISRYLGRGDIVFGNTVAGRPPEIADIDSSIGMFLNTVPVRVLLQPSATLAELLAKTGLERLDRMEYEYLPLAQITEAAGHRLLFDVLFVLQNFIADSELGAEYGVIGSTSLDYTHYPLNLVVTPGPRLTVKLESRPDLIDADQAQGFLDEFLGLLTLIATNEQAMTVPLARLEVGGIRGAVLRGHACPVGTDSIADLLAAQALATPQADALVLGERRLTFAELDAEINRLARVLKSAGACPEAFVALAIPRTIEMVVALFAVLRTGAGYVPLELEHPDERLLTILDAAAPVVVVATTATARRFADRAVPILVLDGTPVRAQVATADPAPLTDAELGAFARTNPARLDYPAYVIFTSGSTGAPKGVVTPYAGLTNMQLNHMREIFAPAIELAGGRQLNIAHTVSFAFDMSWEELLWLAFGHTVHICDEQLRRDPVELVRYCDAHQVDVINVTPTYAEHLITEGLLEQGDGRHRPALVLLGGEAVGDGVWNQLRDTDSTYGYNLYGPTEYTINTLGGGTADSATPTVGRPIFNTDAYLLDSWLRPVAAGQIGELYVSGIGLARGYLDRAGLTADRFVADPAVPGGRMYRTGDLVRLDPAGNLEFHGRGDDQVKVRGYRVEPNEIASAITRLAGIERAVVIADKSESATRLLAYVVLAPDAAPETTGTVRGQLADLLPAYMVPAAVAAIATIPMTVNGKLDIAALPVAEPVGAGGREPESQREQQLCDVFADVLGRPTGVEDSFFDLGGHSLLIMTLRRALRDRLGLDVPIAELFTHPSPAALAAKLDRQDSGDHAKMTAPILTLRLGTGGDPVCCLPPGAGLGWQYTQLTRYLPEASPVFAIQAPFIAGEQDVSTDLRELAREYADLLVATAPAERYRLVGWSFGGNVALAVAAELQARGLSVPAVVMLDSAAEPPRRYVERRTEMAPAAAALLSLGMAVAPDDLGRLSIADAVERIRGSANFLADFETSTLEAVIRTSVWSLEVMVAAQYPTYRGDVLFVRATAAAPRGRTLTAENAHQWDEFVDGRVRIVDVDTTHHQLLDRAAVDGYGLELERELSR
ncbi:amino acid adenylation domain-containing protein [Nocardia sp. CA-128927]|uniref:amino acid adenylation domain-containing protein n=1 Tax=Nocardia sp. CA-128927 TaxID=3239975 RepID=UPI003D98C1DD